MIKIYEDSNWKIEKLSNIKEISEVQQKLSNAKPWQTALQIKNTSVFFKILQKESSGEYVDFYVICDINELPVKFYFSDENLKNILDISDVTEFIPLQILSKVFKYVKENETTLPIERFRILIYRVWKKIKGNYDIQNNLIEIINITNDLKIIIKFNDKNFSVTLDNVTIEDNNLKISGKLIIPGKKDFKFFVTLNYVEFARDTYFNFTKFLSKLIETNLNNLEEYSPKKEYNTFSLQGTGRGSKSFTFGKLPDKSGKRTLQFIEYIKNKTSKGECATTKGFLESINKPTYSGYLSSFFSAIYNAGLVDREKNPSGSSKYCYVLGKNYQAWVEGRLKKIHG